MERRVPEPYLADLEVRDGSTRGLDDGSAEEDLEDQVADHDALAEARRLRVVGVEVQGMEVSRHLAERAIEVCRDRASDTVPVEVADLEVLEIASEVTERSLLPGFGCRQVGTLVRIGSLGLRLLHLVHVQLLLA